jgi:hypothetical protein
MEDHIIQTDELLDVEKIDRASEVSFFNEVKNEEKIVNLFTDTFSFLKFSDTFNNKYKSFDN